MASRSIKDLNPYMQKAAAEHVRLCAQDGVDLLIYCTLRPLVEQRALYACGRTEKGDKVTNARPGESAHNPDINGQAAAYDCVPLVGGKAMWNTRHPAWRSVVSRGEEAGALAAARWTGNLRESAHFQDPTWRKPKC